MNKTLWTLQIIFGINFLVVGVMHFILPEGLPDLFAWMYDLSDTLHLVTGIAEIAGGLGLILPGLTKIGTQLTPLAATGLMIVMIGAIVWHAGRDETQNMVNNAFLIAVMAFIAWGRWRVVPLATKAS